MAGETEEQSFANVELWLEGLGLDASAMDPVSLEALSDVLLGKQVDFESRGLEDDPSQQRTVRTVFVKDEREAKRLMEAVDLLHADESSKLDEKPRSWESLSDLNLRGDVLYERKVLPVYPYEDDESIVIPDEATAVERLILEKLGHQSKILKTLERRLDELTKRDGKDKSNSAAALDPHSLEAMLAHEQAIICRTTARAQAPRPRVVVIPNAPIHFGPPPRRAAPFGVVSRCRKCYHLFTSLRRHQVPNERIDGWMLVKIMFMLSILLSKDQSKLFTTLAVVVLGFLWQSGLAGFLYKFIVRHNYVGRIILHDEDITFASALAEQLQPAAQGLNPQANGQAQRPPWWHANPNRPAIVNALIDVTIVVASLFLSIFPMWRFPDLPAPNEPPTEAAADFPQGNQLHPDGMIPEVRPPIDPAADSDNEDDYHERVD